MKRLLIVPLLAVALAACGGSDGQQPAGSASTPVTTAAPSNTQLTVTYWADPSTSSAPTVTTVTAAGSATAATFDPVPADQACTQIYGGPEKATVKGTLNGVPVDGTFTRANGCEIARWDTMVQLKILPPGSA
jgi:hypothetical protein